MVKLLRRLFPNLFKIEPVKWLAAPLGLLFAWSIYVGLIDAILHPGVTDPASASIARGMDRPNNYQAAWNPCHNGFQISDAGEERTC